MMKVSVIIPAYNVEDTIDRCIKSVIAQTYENLEILCINDGSSDNTLEKIREKAKIDNRIKVLDKPNSGYGSTINLGIEKATGDYISIIESDDFAEKDMIETLVNCAEEWKADVVKANYYEYWSDGTKKTVNYLAAFAENEVHTNVARLCTLGPTIWAGLYRRSFLNDNDIWLLDSSGASFQDTGFAFKVMINAPKVVCIKKPILNYTVDNEKSSVHDREKVFCVCNEFEEIKYYLVKHNAYVRMGICNIYQYYTYLWNINRLDPIKQIIFALRAHYEFLDQFNRGFVIESYYSKDDYKKMMLWVSDICRFINTYLDAEVKISVKSIHELIPFLVSLDPSGVMIYDTGENNDLYGRLNTEVDRIRVSECPVELDQRECLLLGKEDKRMMRTLVLIETASTAGREIVEWMRGNKLNNFIGLNYNNIHNFDLD